VIAPAPLEMTADRILAMERDGDTAAPDTLPVLGISGQQQGPDKQGYYLLQPDQLRHLDSNFRLIKGVDGPAIRPGARLFRADKEVMFWEGPDAPSGALRTAKRSFCCHGCLRSGQVMPGWP